MSLALMGRKVGMTRVFTEDGRNVPVTVVAAGPCYVSQVKTPQRDGYSAVQLAFEDLKPRRSTQPEIGHDLGAGLSPKRFHQEMRLEDDAVGQFEVGQRIAVEDFSTTRFVDVVGTSKGRGFQGGMKRHNFKGQPDSHGTKRSHRSSGAIAGHAMDPGVSGGPKKGKRMPGQTGNERVTERNLDLVEVDPANGLLLIQGPVPGPSETLLTIRPAKRLRKRKARLAEEAAGEQEG